MIFTFFSSYEYIAAGLVQEQVRDLFYEMLLLLFSFAYNKIENKILLLVTQLYHQQLYTTITMVKQKFGGIYITFKRWNSFKIYKVKQT